MLRREYLNEEQVWSGLIVEVIKRLEERLGPEHRASMRGWWRSWQWAIKLRLNLRFLLAWQYNWQERCALMWIQWLLPILLAAFILLPLAVYGSKQLWEMNKKDHTVKVHGAVSGHTTVASLVQDYPRPLLPSAIYSAQAASRLPPTWYIARTRSVNVHQYHTCSSCL
jgi:hypothetical protein